jgi:hypothetical protein
VSEAREQRWEAVQGLEKIYRNPEAAQRRIEKGIERQGHEATYRALRDRPESFGRLEGSKLLGQETLKEARHRAHLRGEQALESHERITTTKQVLGRAEKLLKETAEVERKLAKLAPAQGHLLAEIGHRSRGIPLRSFERVGAPESRLKGLRDIHQAERELG